MNERLYQRSQDLLSAFAQLWNMVDDLPILFKIDLVLLHQIGNPAFVQRILRDGVPLCLTS